MPLKNASVSPKESQSPNSFISVMPAPDAEESERESHTLSLRVPEPLDEAKEDKRVTKVTSKLLGGGMVKSSEKAKRNEEDEVKALAENAKSSAQLLEEEAAKEANESAISGHGTQEISGPSINDVPFSEAVVVRACARRKAEEGGGGSEGWEGGWERVGSLVIAH